MMKRFSIILLGALAILMAGCSKDSHTASNESDDWTINVDLPVPIEFGSLSVQTKAAMDTPDDLVSTEGNFKAFSVFAVDKDATDLSASDAYMSDIDNVGAYYMKGENEDEYKFVFGTQGNLHTYFYPMTSDVSYTFYGLYNREDQLQSEGESTRLVTKNATEVLVPMKNLATNFGDILWGKAEAPKIGDYDGYNARYIRKVVNTGDASKPCLNFMHMTSKLSFEVGLFTEEENEFNIETDKLSVKHLYLQDVPTTCDLCLIATENSEHKEGTLVNMGNNADKYLKDESNNFDFSASAFTSLNTYQTLGTPIFIAPQEGKLDFTIVLTGTVGGITVNQTLNHQIVLPNEGKFEAGKAYAFKIKVYSPTEINVTATLQEYEDAFTNEEDGVIEIM